MADTVLTELKIHEFDTVAQFLQHESEVGENDLAFTPFMPANLYLFYHNWADHIVNDPSWLRADTFSWQSGDMYQSAYQHLVADAKTAYAWISGSEIFYTSKETVAVGDEVYVSTTKDSSTIDSVGNNTITFAHPRKDGVYTATRSTANDRLALGLMPFMQSETIGGTTIEFIVADDGHKICAPDQESNLIALYESTGVAWYYILDTDNKQFKLPRSKHNKYADTVPVVGNGTALGITNGTDEYGAFMAVGGNGNYVSTKTANSGTVVGGIHTGGTYPTNNQSIGVSTAPEKSGVIAKLGQDTDQYKYLYFYIGHFEQDELEKNAGIGTELFNGKADRDLMNTTNNVDIVVESQLPTESNGYTWYRKYKSGWVEQGGRVIGVSQDASVTLPIEMANSYYSVSITPITGVNNAGGYESGVKKESQTTTGFHIAGVANSANGNHSLWQVSGMSA